MTQIQTKLWERLAQVGLWGLLVCGPLAFYVLVVVVEAIGWSDIRRSIEITLLVYGWPILLVGLVAYVALVSLVAVRKRWLGLIRLTINKLGWPLAVGLGAYLLACLLHKVLPTEVLYPFNNAHTMSLVGAEPLYWWPFDRESQVNYTIYPPSDPRFVLAPTGEAACIKLAALLAALLCYRRYHSRPITLSSSVKSAQSA